MNEKQLRAELDAVYGSTSWRITAPLRWLSALLRRYIIQPLSPRRWISLLASFVIRNPALRHWIKQRLDRFPRLLRWVRRQYHHVSREQIVPVVTMVEAAPSSLPVKHLSRTSQLLYNELKHAVKQGK